MELWFSENHTPDVKLSLRVDRQLYSKKSIYQKIDVLETPEFGKVLVLDGNIMLTERDEFIYDEMITHVPMAVHPNIKKVLVIGIGDGGVVRELTRYEQIKRIDLVEMDEMVAEACRQYLPDNACRLDDARVHISYGNALKFIRRCEDKYDLIIVDSNDPFGPSEGLFTREFYGNCYKALKESAIRSLVTREYFIPICPMAIPSHTAMAGNTIGVPPAMATPIFTASTILSMFICPGTISL